MSQGKPILSVCFPCYMREADANETLAILRRSVSIPYEVVIVDNSPEPVKLNLQPHERLLLSGGNIGAAARNIAIRESRGEFILQLDDDSHPLPGRLEPAMRLLDESGPDIAGITSQVVKPDGSIENTPLLPSVFHGCGVLFRKSALDVVGDLYPEDFLFYGEEYWSTLLLMSHGFSLKHMDAFRVCHRFSGEGRSKERIIHRLALNNRRTWAPFAPERLADSILAQTSRRYELVAAKEGVPDAYARAMAEPLGPGRPVRRLSEDEFARYSLLESFRALVRSGTLRKDLPALLCGCGKFPLLWSEELEDRCLPRTLLTDFNPGIAGKDYCGRTVLTLAEALELAKAGRCQPVVGHCSVGDSIKWAATLKEAGVAGIARLSF